MLAQRVHTSNTREIPEGAKNGICLPVLRIDTTDYNLEEMSRHDLSDLRALLEESGEAAALRRADAHQRAMSGQHRHAVLVVADDMCRLAGKPHRRAAVGRHRPEVAAAVPGEDVGEVLAEM